MDKVAPANECPTVYKLHGSLTWVNRDGEIQRAETLGRFEEHSSARIAALLVDSSFRAIATPGPTKLDMLKNGDLKELWDRAGAALEAADELYFLGYRIPPSDSFTREWLIAHIGRNINRRVDEGKRSGHIAALRAHTVLGPDVESTDSQRLRGLLQELAGSHVSIHPRPMFAEDFLSTYKARAALRERDTGSPA